MKSNRALPENISPHHSGGYIVRVLRRGIRYQAFTRGDEAGLAQAIRLRDEFIAASGKVFRHRTHAVTSCRSNTRHIGITELLKWVRYNPRRAFYVSWQRDGVRRRKYIFYGPRCRSRDEALRMAVEYRRRHAPPVAPQRLAALQGLT